MLGQDQAALQPSSDLKSLADFAYQPVAFERYRDMTDNLSQEDMVDFILKMKTTYKDVIDKIVSAHHPSLFNRKISHGLRGSRSMLFMTISIPRLDLSLPRPTKRPRTAVPTRPSLLS